MLTESVGTELTILKGTSRDTDARRAVAELAEQILQPKLSGVVFFASSRYDLESLGTALRETFRVPIIGCTTSGEITQSGYGESTLTGFSLTSDQLQMRTYPIEGLRPLDSSRLSEIEGLVADDLAASASRDPKWSAFGLVMIDGLSIMEEQVIARLHQACRKIPIIGGSAGDDLRFEQTHVFVNGHFRSDAAVLAVVTTALPFAAFKTQHFEPSDQKLVITRADVPKRIVHEINGMPAAREYARMIGIEIDELEPMVFSKHPLMLRIGGEYYVRSIQKVNADGSLTFFCAIDEGLVLTLSEGVDILTNLENTLKAVTERVPNTNLVIGCECILRRLEVLELGITERYDDLLKRYNLIGFHTYGEQFNSIHVNQTFTGVAIGQQPR